MIEVSDRLKGVIGSRSFRMVCRATITRGRTVLATDLPVDEGREESDVSLTVPERVTLRLPRVIRGVDWAADGIDSPIMPWGQRVHVKLGIGVGADGYEWINRGEFLIHNVQVDADSITVTAVGLLFLLDEARLVAPYKPTGTISAAIRRLVEPALSVKIDPSLTDRSAAGTNVVEEDRLQGVLDLLKAWPAEAHVTPAGYLQVEPQGTHPTSLDADLYVLRYHVPGNTILKPNVQTVTTAATREGIVNAVVARGVNAAGAPITAAVYDTSGGPASYRGPFNPLPVPEFVSHGAARTVQFAGAIARARLNQLQAPFRRAWQLECVPNPRMLVRDRLLYFPDRGDVDNHVDVVVDRLVMPYTAASGPMVLNLREVA